MAMQAAYAALTLAFFTSAAAAHDYAAKPIKLIVPFPRGGSARVD